MKSKAKATPNQAITHTQIPMGGVERIDIVKYGWTSLPQAAPVANIANIQALKVSIEVRGSIQKPSRVWPSAAASHLEPDRSRMRAAQIRPSTPLTRRLGSAR